MTDIATALTVLNTHLVAAGGALTDPLLDVDRGLPTGGRQIRYYWDGEYDAAEQMGATDTLTSSMVGERFAIAATWPLTNLDIATVTSIDAEMQTLAGEVRTRILGDSQLGGNVADLTLGYGSPDVVLIGNQRCVALRWQLDLAYVEYTVAA